jgi:hypothetical protein
MKHEDAQVPAADEGRIDRRVRALSPERVAFVAWLRAYAGGCDNWQDNVLMGEHDVALSAWRHQQLEIETLQRALMHTLPWIEETLGDPDLYPSNPETAGTLKFLRDHIKRLLPDGGVLRPATTPYPRGEFWIAELAQRSNEEVTCPPRAD